MFNPMDRKRKSWIVWLTQDGTVHCIEMVGKEENLFHAVSDLEMVACIHCVNRDDAIKQAKEYFIERLLEVDDYSLRRKHEIPA